MADQPEVVKTKKTWEKVPEAVEFIKVLQQLPGETLQAGSTVIIYDNDTGADVTAQMLVAVNVFTSTKLQAIIKGGDLGKTYRLEFQGLTQTYQFQEDVFYKIVP